MRQGSKKLGVMQSISDRLENEMHENMRLLTILQRFGLSYITWEIHYVYCTKCTYTVVVYPFARCVYCFVNVAASYTIVTMPLLLLCHFTLVPLGGIISRLDCMP